MSRLHLDRFELAERGVMWTDEDGNEETISSTEVAAELRALRRVLDAARSCTGPTSETDYHKLRIAIGIAQDLYDRSSP